MFRRTVGKVKRLRHDRILPSHARPAPIPRFSREDERQVLDDLLSDGFEPAEMETGEELLYRSAGLQLREFRKLRRGQFSVQAELDLHGMTVAVARQELTAFLHQCMDQGLRCVRIVHGKGNRSSHRGPVLKTKVNHWLRQRQEVLAFASTRPVDGGTGAVYVLLRRAR